MMDYNELDKRYVLKYSPEHQKMIYDVANLNSKIEDLTHSNQRMERYLIGGVDENGKYIMGLFSWIRVLTATVGLAIMIIVPLAVEVIAHYIFGASAKP